MTDIAILWNGEIGFGDIAVDGVDLAIDTTLQTAVLVSLFTDRRVDVDELPIGETDRRGWWGDLLSQDDDQIGSKLWLLSREKQTPDVLVRAEQYSVEALQWMIQDGVARAVEATAVWVRGILSLCINVVLPRGGSREFQFQLNPG